VSPPLSHIRPVPRRGLSRNEAAMYFGISTSTFDKLVAENRVPRPRRIGERKIWDVRELDVAFEALPHEDALSSSSWEDA
jgi:predicted DNA-binding transcriptional regulator AlpA